MSASSDRMEDEPANDKFEDENGDKIDDWERDPFDALLESAPEWVLCETLRNLGEDDADDLAVHVMAVFNPWEDVDSEDTEDEDPPPVAPSAKKRKTEPVATDDNDAGQSEPGHENEDEDEDDIDDHTEGNPVEIEVTEEGYRQQLVDDFLKDAPAPALRKAIASLCEYSGRRGWATSSLTNLYHDFDRTVCQGLVRHGKRPWTETCAGCKQTYDEALNEMGSCSFFRWHCDPPMIDYQHESWCDTDFRIHSHGFLDNAEGYFWPCCGKQCEENGKMAPPCTKFAHVAMPNGRYAERSSRYKG